MTNQTINPPDLDDLLAESRGTLLSNFNAVQIGKIETVNDDQTVSVTIQFLRRLPDGKTGKYPLLVDVPYFVLNGGGSYLDFPIAVGDYCLILFCDRNIDNWWDTANVAVPADIRKHSIADGIALVGINPRTKAFERDGAAFRIIGPTGSNSFISFKADGSIELNAPSGFKITANTEITGTLTVSGIIKSLVDIIADYAAKAISLLSHFHLGNLGYNTGIPVDGAGVPKPANGPTGDSSGNIDMKGNDLLNVKDSVGGQTNHSAHGHTQPNDGGGDVEQKTNGPS